METIEYRDLPKYQKRLGLPIHVVPNFNNAYYVTPSSTPLPKDTVKIKDTTIKNVVNAVNRMRGKPEGGVVIGDAFLTPTALAHEKGHHLDKSWLSGIAPGVETFWSKYHMPLVGTIGAELVGLFAPKAANTARLTNLGVQALSAVPELYSEYKASEIAKKEFPEANEEKLDSWYKTYLKKALINRLLSPALAHGVMAGFEAFE